MSLPVPAPMSATTPARSQVEDPGEVGDRLGRVVGAGPVVHVGHRAEGEGGGVHRDRSCQGGGEAAPRAPRSPSRRRGRSSASPPPGSTTSSQSPSCTAARPRPATRSASGARVARQVAHEPVERGRPGGRLRVLAAHPLHVLRRRARPPDRTARGRWAPPDGCGGRGWRGPRLRARRACASSSAGRRSRACRRSRRGAWHRRLERRAGHHRAGRVARADDQQIHGGMVTDVARLRADRAARYGPAQFAGRGGRRP